MAKNTAERVPYVVAVIALVLLILTSKGVFIFERIKFILLENLLLTLIGIILILWWLSKR